MEHGVAGQHLPSLFNHFTRQPSTIGSVLFQTCMGRLNRLRTGIGLFLSTMHKCGMVPIAAYECGAKEQTAEHVITSCPVHHCPNGAHVPSAVDKSLVHWLTETCPAISWTALRFLKQRKRSADLNILAFFFNSVTIASKVAFGFQTLIINRNKFLPDLECTDQSGGN